MPRTRPSTGRRRSTSSRGRRTSCNGNNPPGSTPPMPYHATVRDERFAFADLREVFGRANEEKSGDHLAGLAARSERERVAAKRVLADLRLGDIVDQPLIDPDHDDVSRLILDSLDQDTFPTVRGWTVGELR